MADLNCYITTFNCARTPIHTSYFAASLFNGLTNAVPPDLLVLCLQEFAPIGYSFLGGSMLAPYYANFAQAVREAVFQKFGPETRFVSVLARNVGMTAIMIFARQEIEHKIRWTETGGTGVGLWAMGNKGAVGTRLGVGLDQGNETAVTFVAAHLAPLEFAWKRRNEDWRSICENLVFERTTGLHTGNLTREATEESEPLLSEDSADAVSSMNDTHTLFNPSSYLFFAGDLNYRTSDRAPASMEYKTWPQPVESTADPQHYTHQLAHDQLSREREKGASLHHLAEAAIDFPPTYKYSQAAQRNVLAASETTEERRLTDGRVVHNVVLRPRTQDKGVWQWAKHRTPSWCDRVLFLDNDTRPHIYSYTCLPVQPTSDHRPVVLSCAIPSKPVPQGTEPPFEINKDWHERRVAARRLEILVGLAAYLGWTWEGEALVAGTVVGVIGGYWVLRAFLGSW